MRKIFVWMLAAMLCFSCIGCNGKGEEPVYGTPDKDFTIGMWVGVPEKLVTYDSQGAEDKSIPAKEFTDAEFLAHYQNVKDAGITLAYPGYDGMQGWSVAYNKRALDAAEQVGIRQLISDYTLTEYLKSAKELVDSGVLTEAQVIAGIQQKTEQYMSYPALEGFFIIDEPDRGMLEWLGYASQVFKKALPDLRFYVNHCPIIAAGAFFGGLTYGEFLDEIIENFDMDYFSYDHYPLKKSGKNVILEDTFLANMDMVRSRLGDREMWTFLQSIEYGAGHRALESKADAAFQVNSFLAYGGSAVQWFCYWSPPGFDGATVFGESMIDRQGNKTPIYDYVQAVNSDIAFLKQFYLHFDWKGIMVSDINGGEGNFEYIEDSALTTHARVKSFTSGDDAIMGVFKDKDDRDGFMITNFTEPSRGIDNKVTVSFKNASSAIVILGGKKEIKSLSGGKLSITLKAGEGCFVIPY